MPGLSYIYQVVSEKPGNRRTLNCSFFMHHRRFPESHYMPGAGSVFRLVSDAGNDNETYLAMDLGTETPITSKFRTAFKPYFDKGELFTLPNEGMEGLTQTSETISIKPN